MLKYFDNFSFYCCSKRGPKKQKCQIDDEKCFILMKSILRFEKKSGKHKKTTKIKSYKLKKLINISINQLHPISYE